MPFCHVPAHEARGCGTRHKNSADHEIRVRHILFDGVHGRVDRVENRPELEIQRVEPLQRDVDDGDLGLKAHGHPGGVRADHAATNNQYVRGGHARDTAKQQARAALRLLKTMGARLDRHAAGHLAIGAESGRPP